MTRAIDEVRDARGAQQYIASDEIATVMFLAAYAVFKRLETGFADVA